MRLTNTLVVAVAAILLASENAFSAATDADQATVSKFAAAEFDTLVDVLTTESKRSLRATVDDGEERYKLFKIEALQQGKWTSFFKKWSSNGRTESDIKKKLANVKWLSESDKGRLVDNYGFHLRGH
uniref:RxLR effector protein n=1 Tax=Phytophthora sojae TaxID=67593 RepID=V5T813_PHYSO|nr:avirulence RXLR effector protein [Phytophthora sojae]